MCTEEEPVFARPQQCLSLELEILQEVLFDNISDKKVQELKRLREDCGASSRLQKYMFHLLSALAENWNEDLSLAVFQTDCANQYWKDCMEPHCVILCGDFENVSVFSDGCSIFQSIDFVTALALMIVLHFVANLSLIHI